MEKKTKLSSFDALRQFSSKTTKPKYTKPKFYHQGSKPTTMEPLIFQNALKINKLTDDEYNNFCDDCRKYVENKRDITTTKLRNIFNFIQKAKEVRDLLKIRPKLAYLAGREKKIKEFAINLDRAIKKIKTKEEMESFKQFFEAIICYKKEIGD